MRTLMWSLALALCLAPVALAEGEDSNTLDIGSKAPDIDIAHWVKGVSLNDRGGFTPITTFEPGHVYVLEFWATWCGPCRSGMPHLSELQEKFKGDVTIIGISDESLPKVVSFLFATDSQDGEVNNDRTEYTITADPDGSVKKDYFQAAGQRGIPCAFIVGKDGIVEWYGHPGNMDDVLQGVVDGTWDREAAKAEMEQEAALQAALQSAQPRFMSALQSSNWAEAVAVLDELLAIQPTHPGILAQKFEIQLTKAKDETAAYETARQAFEAASDNPGMLNGIAWTITTGEGIENRDLDLALKMATQASELTENKDPSVLDTVARVYFERGDAATAAEWQQKAIDNVPDDPRAAEFVADLRKTLDKYKEAAASSGN